MNLFYFFLALVAAVALLYSTLRLLFFKYINSSERKPDPWDSTLEKLPPGSVSPAPEAPSRAIGKIDDVFQKIVLLNDELEAVRLKASLDLNNIPHRMRSYYDTAYDGLYQHSMGWGSVHAPIQYKEQILRLIDYIRKSRSITEVQPITKSSDKEWLQFKRENK